MHHVCRTVLALIPLMYLACEGRSSGTPSISGMEALGEGLFALLRTDKGDIVLALEFEKAPLTVANFVGLAEGKLRTSVRSGQPFYDGLTFHRVVPDFVIQGGDPQGNGRGGPGYRFPDEITELKHDRPGVLSMANAGPDTNGSQFFITLRPTPHLDGKHSVFGRVVRGMEVVQAIQPGDRIQSLSIHRLGAAAEAFTVDQARFDELVQLTLRRREEELRQRQEANLALVQQRWPNARVNASGLRFTVDRPGSGQRPRRGQTVRAHYEGRLLTGEVFDSSYRRGEPLEFPVGVGQVIAGWDEALLDMRPGEKRTLIIPPHLAYGAEGAPPVIPPHAWLVFEVELLALGP